MKAPPLLFGGRSPVVAYLRHSMIVWLIRQRWPSISKYHTYRLARAIVPYDKSQRCVELYRFTPGIVERSDTAKTLGQQSPATLDY